MMQLTRLDSISRNAGEAFRHATWRQRRRAVLAACEFAVRRSELNENIVAEALALLRAEKAPDITVRQRLEELAARLDDQYFDASKEPDEALGPDGLGFFSKARAAAALAYAFGDPERIHEAIYEAIATTNDQEELLKTILATLHE